MAFCLQCDYIKQVSSEIILIYPPVALPSEPPLGLAMLAAELRTSGAQVEIIDANLESLHHFLDEVAPTPGAQLTTAQHRALKQREQARQQLCGGSAYQNYGRYGSAVSTVCELLGLASARFHPRWRLGLADFQDQTFSPLRSVDLSAAAASGEDHPYRDYFEKLACRLAAKRPRLVGVSLNYLHQALPAMMLAASLRRQLGSTPLLLGGALLSCWRDRLAANSLQPYFDEIIFDSGTSRIWQLLNRPSHNFSSIFPPDYREVKFERYFAPQPIAPLSLSRGCYWSRCNYCPEALAQTKYQAVPHSVTVDFIDQVRQKSGAEFLHFTDSALSPAALEILAAQTWSCQWYGFARFHPRLANPQFVEKLRLAGCQMLQLGLESASPAMLSHLRKGVSSELASRVLRCLADAGIDVFLYVMFGIPGETRADAEATTNFVSAHAQAIKGINTALLNVPQGYLLGSDLAPQPFAGAHCDLSLYVGFSSSRGWQRREARQYMEREFAKEPNIAEIIRRTPPIFGPNHAPFLPR